MGRAGWVGLFAGIVACATASGSESDVGTTAPAPGSAGTDVPVSSGGTNASSTSSSGATATDAGAAPNDPAVVFDGGPPCTCPDANQGCLQVAVHRAGDDSVMPWKRGIAGADGVGALTVTFSQSGVVAARGGAPNVDLRGGVTYRAIMCAPAGIWDVNVFLDDNGNAGAMEVGSVEAADSCSSPASVSVLVNPGSPRTMSATLVGSCH